MKSCKKVAMLVGASMLVFLVGCGSSNVAKETNATNAQTVGEENSQQQTEKKPEKVVKKAFDAIKKTDMDTLSKILTGEKATEIVGKPAFLELIKASNKTLEYKVGDAVINGDQATVTVECTYGDVKTTFETAFKGYFKNVMDKALSGEKPTEEELNGILAAEVTSALEANELEAYSATVEVPCVKIDNKWAIDSNAENIALADVMTGNLVSTMNEMAESMNQSK